MAVLYEMRQHHLTTATGVPLLIRGLTQLAHNLEKAEEWAKENNVPTEQLVNAKLIDTMQPLKFQVQFASNSAKAVLHRIAGHEWVTMEDNETTMDQLKDRVARTLTVLRGAEGKQADFEGKEQIDVTVPIPGKDAFKFKGAVYISYWVIPNFFFHITTAYDILRKEGVPLSKVDFLGYP